MPRKQLTPEERKAAAVRRRQKDAIRKQTIRQDPSFRLQEQVCNTENHRQARQDPSCRLQEQVRNTENHRQARQDPSFRLEEQVRDTENHRQARQDPLFRLQEQVRDTENHRQARQDPLFRLQEQDRNTENHRQARQDPLFRSQEQVRDTENHRQARQDPLIRLQEQARNTENHRQARLDEDMRIHEHNLRRIREQGTWPDEINRFEAEIRKGCTHVCHSCGGLFFHYSIKTHSMAKLLLAGKQQSFLASVIVVPTTEDLIKFCSTCHSSIQQNRIPRLCLSNDLQFPYVPQSVKNLTRLEARLVAARHVFQSIWAVYGTHGQMRTKGRIINVPVSIDNTVQSLPRLPNQDDVLHIRLARQIEVPRNYTAGNIRPACVMGAARILANSPLYREYGISLSNDWTDRCRQQISEALNDDPEDIVEVRDEEEVDDINPSRGETMITSDEGIRMAPAEGSQPISVLYDPDSYFLTFPQLFAGHRMKPCDSNGKLLSRSEVAKSMARNSDRRAVESVDFLLFLAKSLEMQRIHDNRKVCLRKRRHNGELIQVTAGQVAHSDFVDGLINDDNAFKVLQGVRNSCHHWHQEGLKVRRMVSQFNLPHLFITISAAELKWNELIVILKHVLDKITISEEEAQQMSKNEKESLIQRDPVTCARYFEHRTSALFKTWKNPHGPFGNRSIKHYYYRIEFQHRGSPHVHMILWLDGIPTFDASNSSSTQEICRFIDEVITCSSDWSDEDPIHQLLCLQTHRHTHTCKKKSHKEVKCRFGIPFFPMDETMILHPFEEQDQAIENLQQDYKKIREYLDTTNENPIPSNMTFDGFLQEISMARDHYISVIRSSLKKSKIFIRRRPCEIYINPYSEKILRLQKANMDIQFILDAYACCCYIIDYINKTDRGTSDLLRKVLEDVQNGNKSLGQRLQALGAAHHMNSELSAQEAAYNVLQIPMSRCTEACIFIPTGPPNQRTRMMKTIIELEQLSADSEDVFIDGLLQRYSSRPEILSNLNLAQFAAWYDFALRRSSLLMPQGNNYTVESEEFQTADNTNKYLVLQNGKPGYLWKRTFPKIIRYVRYNKNKDRQNFFREQVMLYHPWRDEQTEIVNQNCEKIVMDNIDTISSNRQEFNAFQEDILDVAMESALTEDRQSDEEENDYIPEEIREEFLLIDPIADNTIDFGGVTVRPFAEKFTLPNRIPDKEFEELFSSLNTQQRDFVTHLLDHFKRSPDIPIYTYLKGGAGVGKSHVIRTLYQTLIRVFNADVNSNPDKPSVLLTAPTGLAAFNIFGLTIHNAFQLPVNQKEATKLSDSVSNTMATLYSELRVLIIDEISMVGQHILEMIDKRLRDLCDRCKPFGGISVIAVGDFRQLPPVMATSLLAGTMSNVISSLFNKPLWHMFTVHELTTIMRQRDDAAFALALNNMASGTMTDDDLHLFKSREFPTVPVDIVAQRPIHLFHTNEAVDAYNRFALSTLPGTQSISTAKDSLSGYTSEASKVALLSWVESAPLSKTQGLHTNLLLKEGGRYIITVNIDTSDGLVNGVGCILKRIDFGISTINASRQKPLRLWVKFENSRSGQKLRLRNSALIRQLHIDSEWTPISPCTVIIQPRSNATTKITRAQFPLNPAEAQTIHKAQGSTYELVVIHFTPGIKRDLLYVACSRATKASGLFLIGTVKKTNMPKENDPISLEFKRHQGMKLIPSFQHLRIRDDRNRQIQIIFHNVQSLPAHYSLYTSDEVYKNSDIILMAETWTLSNDNFSIGSHFLAASVDSNDVRRAIGARVYCCALVHEHIVDANSELENDIQGSCSISSITFSNIRVIVVYKSPGCNSNVIISLIKKQMSRSYVPRTLIAGDFNEDFSKASSNGIQRALGELGLQIRSPAIPTTRNGTQIDAIFSNFKMSATGVYTSISSYHEPLWARINL